MANARLVRCKLWISVYFFAFAAFAFLSIVPNTSIPVEANYAALLTVFMLPVLIALKFDVPLWVLSIFVFATPFITMLAVVGPNEAGFYGYDPNNHTMVAYELFQSGWGEVTSWLGHWPAFPAAVSVVVEVTGLDVETAGKYLPLIVATVPLFLFRGLARVVDDSAAFLAAIGAASSQKLLTFQVKFIEEPLAMVLLFFSIAAVFVVSNPRKQAIVVVPAMSIIGLVHHYIAVVGAVIFLLWSAVRNLSLSSRFDTIHTRFVPTAVYGIIATVVLAFVFLFPYESFSRFVTVKLITGFDPPSLTGSAAQPAFERKLLVWSSFVVYFAMSTITAAGVLSKGKTADWEFAWAVLSGIFAVGFLGTTVAGKIVPLSAGRYLGFMILLLTPVTVVMLVNKRVTVPRPKTVAVVLVTALVITQLALVPAYVIDTNPSQMVYLEAHYTSSEYAAADWMKIHGQGQLIADEHPRFWTFSNKYDNVSRLSDAPTCKSYSVQRSNYLGIDQWVRPAGHNVFYSAGGITIGSC
ncbi:hypothetical protein [Haloprofundus sp. MHR1]|uniref:hypothetical protein n=1 Tax=Haloprofundus sp. MHR1 TaxID=2572921 RepID=UPI0010BF1AB4|nr:hypothetical protein [Haloprofundus sp. MHR1]QCJ45971.1 hypothetical protein FCF25_02025 [Haloprofundus sp. MHR1]